jgi:hypothetical protein
MSEIPVFFWFKSVIPAFSWFKSITNLSQKKQEKNRKKPRMTD